MDKGYTQEEIAPEGIERINEDLESKFGEFGGKILKVFVTKIGAEDDPNFNYKISIVVDLTVGGKNNFIIKEKIDYAEYIITNIFGREKLSETIIQINNPYKSEE